MPNKTEVEVISHKQWNNKKIEERLSHAVRDSLIWEDCFIRHKEALPSFILNLVRTHNLHAIYKGLREIKFTFVRNINWITLNLLSQLFCFERSLHLHSKPPQLTSNPTKFPEMHKIIIVIFFACIDEQIFRKIIIENKLKTCG